MLHESGKGDSLPAVSSSDLKRLAVDAGLDAAGVAGVEQTPEHQFFPEWIADGCAGEMKYLEARNDADQLKRASLGNAAPWARAVVVCALNYNTDHPYSTHAGAPTQGWISRYAWSQADYHDLLLKKLRAMEAKFLELCRQREIAEPRTWCYVDTGPVIERVVANYAGIGWIGKNTCMISEQLGSNIYLGVMLTSLPLQPDLPAGDRCGSCTRCIDACPTNALHVPYQIDAPRCIAYLTIELRGPIPEELRPGIGRQVFGCDICQDVCPWNRQSPTTSVPELQARERLVNPDLEWLAQLTVEEFREVFRGSPVKRAKVGGLRRNVAVAMANSGDERFLPILEKLSQDEDPLVAEHATWGLGRLRVVCQAK
ncbi:MAG TPA: tRNA epoxyqueuosine(34) reductase QueG [Terriglobales bacterium]|nr:tRNA epoxyqueuosine(34) reductase QueG [Terriglobales bacterium]